MIEAALNIADRVTKWLHPVFNQKDRLRRKVDSLIKERDALLDKQKDWVPGDADRLDAVLGDLKRTQRLLDSLKD